MGTSWLTCYVMAHTKSTHAHFLNPIKRVPLSPSLLGYNQHIVF